MLRTTANCLLTALVLLFSACDRSTSTDSSWGVGPGDSYATKPKPTNPAHPLLATLSAIEAHDNSSVAINSAMAASPMLCLDGIETLSDEEQKAELQARDVYLDTTGTSCDIECTTTTPIVFRYLEFAGMAYEAGQDALVHLAANTTFSFALNDRHPDVLLLPNSAATVPLKEVWLRGKKYQPAFHHDTYSERKVRLYFEVDGELRVHVFELEGWAG